VLPVTGDGQAMYIHILDCAYLSTLRKNLWDGKKKKKKGKKNNNNFMYVCKAEEME
jgi:hypothetical protein